MLITLVIIGIIAAITVPLIITNYQKQQTVSKLKKVYSTISNAVNLASVQNGSSADSWFDDVNCSASDYLNNYLKPYLQILKVCNDYSDCGYSSSTPFLKTNGATYGWHMQVSPSSRQFFYLSDGNFISVNTGTLVEGGIENYANVEFIVDINGTKPPNKMGRDVFMLEIINENGIQPKCSTYTQAKVNSNCTKSGEGTCCLQKILSDNWEIKDDYPW